MVRRSTVNRELTGSIPVSSAGNGVMVTSVRWKHVFYVQVVVP